MKSPSCQSMLMHVIRKSLSCINGDYRTLTILWVTSATGEVYLSRNSTSTRTPVHRHPRKLGSIQTMLGLMTSWPSLVLLCSVSVELERKETFGSRQSYRKHSTLKILDFRKKNNVNRWQKTILEQTIMIQNNSLLVKWASPCIAPPWQYWICKAYIVCFSKMFSSEILWGSEFSVFQF